MKILCQIIRLYVPFMCTVLGLVHGILFFTHQLTDERIYLLSALFSMLVSLYIVATSRKMCRWYKLNTLFLSIIQLLGIVYFISDLTEVSYFCLTTLFSATGVSCFLVYRITKTVLYIRRRLVG